LYLATKAGMGFAMLPNWATSKDLQNGNLELVMPHLLWPKLHIHAIYADRSYMPAKVRSFLDFLAGPEGIKSAVS
ncbi:MAG: LysR substrate-binding domain-containing protein, partial [Nitratireductor sp.]